MNRGAERATVHEVAKSQTPLSNFHFHFIVTELAAKPPWLSALRPMQTD